MPMDILQRLFNIARAYGLPHKENIEKIFRNNMYQDYGSYRSDSSEKRKDTGCHGKGTSKETEKENAYPAASPQLVADLAVFDLHPPSSLKEVRMARKREIKRYHSDKFMYDEEKLEAAKEIMQVYNAAYERLEEFYGKT